MQVEQNDNRRKSFIKKSHIKIVNSFVIKSIDLSITREKCHLITNKIDQSNSLKYA